MKTSTLILTVLASALLTGFQNCSPVDFAMAKKIDGTNDLLICDPFSATTTCSSNVKAQIYRLDESQRTLHGTEGLDTYFTYGTRLDAQVYLDRLFIPTVPFTTGFPASTGATLADENGDVLIEYFAMKLTTNLTLPSNAAAGTYQIALLSDDGTRLTLSQTGERLIDNDGSHPTTLGCATRTIDLQPGEKLPIAIDYYQGPRMHIALTLMWRKVTPSTTLSEPLCSQGGNDFYFGPNYDDYSNAYGFGQLTERGWTPVPAANLTGVGN